MVVTVHQNSREIDNGVEKDSIDNMPLYFETKGEDVKVQKEELFATPESSKTEQERELLPLPSLHKAANPYRPPIPPICHTQKIIDEKPLKLKDPESFIVNITIGG